MEKKNIINKRHILSKRRIITSIIMCSIFIVIDIWSIVRELFNINIIERKGIDFLLIAVGLYFLYEGWKLRPENERKSCYILGVSFILKALSFDLFSEHGLEISIVYTLLDLFATLNFWICYQKIAQELQERVYNIQSRKWIPKEGVMGLIVIITFLGTIFFCWVYEMIKMIIRK